METDIRVHSLASGSSGNCMLIRSNGMNLLIDAGLSARAIENHCRRLGVAIESLSAILLTHEHSDHIQGAATLARRAKAPIVGNSATLNALRERSTADFPTLTLPTSSTITLGETTVRSFPIPHNAVEPVGWVVESGQGRIAYATDVGSITDDLREAVRGAQLVIIEANHDIRCLWHGSYSPQMKAQVASPVGHLSNEECAELLAERMEEGTAATVWLAHLSRQNNAPSLAKRTIEERLAKQKCVPHRVEVAMRDQPSVSWRYGAQAFQMSLL